MFKKIFQRIFLIIVQPAKAWHVLEEDDMEDEKFLSHYLYPIFGIIALAAFIGSFISYKSVELALKSSIQEFVAYFAGFYLAVFLLRELIARKFDYAVPAKNQHFVAYASSLIYMVSILVSLLGFHMLLLFLPYTIYIIWEGSLSYMKIREDDQVRFAVIATLIVFVPYMIGFIINKFMLITPHATTG